MFDEQDVERRDNDEDQGSSGKAYLIIGSLALGVYLVFTFVGKPGMALTAFFCTVAIMVAVGICWDLRTRIWFWLVIAVVVGLHVPLLLVVKWPHNWIPGMALAPIGIADCFIIVGIVHFVQRYIVRDVPPDEDE